MRESYLIAGALVAALAAAGCGDSRSTDTPRTTAADEQAEAARRAEDQRHEHEQQAAQLDERVMKLERDYQEHVPAEPRGTAGRTAPNARRELTEDIAHVKQAVADLRTTSAQNWWERHASALKQSADDVEADVKRIVGNRTLPAPEHAKDAPATPEAASPAPFESARDRLVNDMHARIDSWKKALDEARIPRARKTELDDINARVDKLSDDIDELKSASADDWWDVSRKRVSDYIGRVEESVARLDDRGLNGRGPDARGRDARDADTRDATSPGNNTTREDRQR